MAVDVLAWLRFHGSRGQETREGALIPAFSVPPYLGSSTDEISRRDSAACRPRLTPFPRQVSEMHA